MLPSDQDIGEKDAKKWETDSIEADDFDGSSLSGSIGENLTRRDESAKINHLDQMDAIDENGNLQFKRKTGEVSTVKALKLVKFCAECGTKFNLDTDKFCTECGARRQTVQ